MAYLLYSGRNSSKFTEGLKRLSWDPLANYSSSIANSNTASAPHAAHQSQQADFPGQEKPVDVQQEFSQQDIGGVVQGVISQFLNGSLSDSRSSRSRKRRRSGKSSRSSREINLAMTEDVSRSRAAKLTRLTADPDEERLLEDEHGVLNLSLPKPDSGLKVTFALEDKCYDEEGVAEFQRPAKSLRAMKVAAAAELTEPVIPVSSDRCLSARSGGVSVVVRPGVISAPRPRPLLQVKEKPPIVSYPTSSTCVHFSDRSGASAAYLPTQKPVSAVYSSFRSDERKTFSSLSGPVAFSSVIKPVQAATASKLTPAPCSEKDKLGSSPITNPLYVKKTKTAAPPPPQPSATRREVIIKATGERPKAVVDLPSAAELTTTGSGETTSSPTTTTNNSTNSNSSSNREMHNRLEKNRRAHLKQCFDELASECELDARKASNLTVIKSALKYIMVLRRKEREHEKELADLVQEKIKRQQLLAQLEGSSPSSFCPA
jgi:hypothetical protein